LTSLIFTRLLDLQVLRWILGAFSAFLAVAVVVIFQPELRRMLAELGNLPLFATAGEQRENIEVIIQTCERLADVKIGALIAIEQSIQLQEAVESGIPVDCEATPEMLETIFFPNNAIHDGGVIIKGDRIAYAACIFPLTQRQDLSKSLGTRHRAAIGITEDTDAAAVVVSEETGVISFVQNGEITRYLTEWRDVSRQEQKSRPIQHDGARALLYAIADRSGNRYGGCWSLFAWRENSYAFFEGKRQAAKDGEQLKPAQAAWVRAALSLREQTMSPQDFALVQWEYRTDRAG